LDSSRFSIGSDNLNPGLQKIEEDQTAEEMGSDYGGSGAQDGPKEV